MGRALASEIKDPKTKKVLFKKNQIIDEADINKLAKLKLDKIKIRSVLTCSTVRGICKKCYGYDLGHNELVKDGTAAGIIAAQSIGEPGTQLTMRTFHTGGVAGQDITQGLPRVEELFEARPLKKSAVLSDVDGQVEEVEEKGPQKIIKVRHLKEVEEVYKLTKKLKPLVKDKQKVKENDPIILDGDGKEVKAKVTGVISLEKASMKLVGEQENIKEFNIPPGFGVWAKPGDLITVGTQLSEGNLDLKQLFALQGQEAVQKYVIKEIQYIYSSQGQKLNDKHIEIIIRQMFSRYLIVEPGDSDFVAQELITRDQLLEANQEIKENKGNVVEADNVLLGITKASLSTDSFLSAASFQETARVLIDAAISGKVDHLRGLKENVIIGKLIPVGSGFGVEAEKKKAKAEEKAKAEKEAVKK